MLPVGIPRTRLNTWSKITSHRTGWTARIRTSLGSRSNFLSSTWAMAKVCWINSLAADGLAEAANSTSGLAYVTVASSFMDRAATELHEDVVQRCIGAQRGF